MSDSTIVSVEGLQKSFRNGQVTISLFNGLSFNVREGDFVAVTGSSGTGKTTLMNIIAGLDMPGKGSVKVFGKELSSLGSRHLAAMRAHSMGLLFQTFGLVNDLTVKENIELTLYLSGKKKAVRERYVHELLQFFGIQDKAQLTPPSLSFGEAKKVGMARALASEPEILLLDEPTGNLDPPSVNVLLPILRGLRHIYGKTIIMTTNSLRAATIANRQVHLERPTIRTA
ncbi:ABC transporter ATP-binding protein [Candidatus Bathyarchaeota archaeon]|nr:ABC transporter ATP-binding protein [Candidatus Bathyarchaeota archaeon]